MGKGKEKWIRFEDGLLKSEYIEKKYAKKNRESYKKLVLVSKWVGKVI